MEKTKIVNYVLGLIFDPSLARVLLIKKNRPALLAGKWLGIGGKIELNEEPLEAMHRELKEEADIEVEHFHDLATMTLPNGNLIHCFYGISNKFNDYQTRTDELIRPFGLKTLDIDTLDIDTCWLIKLAIANLRSNFTRKLTVQLSGK
jgi:8-oxo-dGTP diphosphatase